MRTITLTEDQYALLSALLGYANDSGATDEFMDGEYANDLEEHADTEKCDELAAYRHETLVNVLGAIDNAIEEK